ncbi:MAG TPA: hypothetical protein VIM07_16395 [Chitinophagaceae bacterium]
MKSLIISLCTFFFAYNASFAQAKIDSTVKPEESTFYDGPVNTIFESGFLLRTRSKNFYEITGKQKQQNKVANPIVDVYKDKRKYKLLIQGQSEPLPATKLQDVIESNINGDFRGWDGTTSFKLLNGDTWVQDEIKTLSSNSMFRPTVYIYRASDGTYKMKVQGVDETIQVKKK